MAEVQESSKPVIVRVKRKPDQSPLHAFWLEINERPLKKPLIDFEKLSISASTSASGSAHPQEELKSKRVLVQHVETLSTSQATVDFLQSFVRPDFGDIKFIASNKERRRTLQKENKYDQILSKARQEQENLAKNARFEQIWKRRGSTEAIHDAAVDEVCRVYDVLRVDTEDKSETVKQQEEISVEHEEALSKFLPLLRECIPKAAEEIESDIRSRPLRPDSTAEFVYDLYAVKEKIDVTEEAYPLALVQIDDDYDVFYDGPDDSDYETDDSNAENNPMNDYPEEESSEEEEESEESGSDSEEEESVEESDRWSGSDNPEFLEHSEDQLSEGEMEDVYNDPDNGYYDDGEGWRCTDD